MPNLEPRQRLMFWAPTRRRHYPSLARAAMAEAGAMVARKYPAEGQWHWTQDDRLQAVRARLARRIEAVARAAKEAA